MTDVHHGQSDARDAANNNWQPQAPASTSAITTAPEVIGIVPAGHAAGVRVLLRPNGLLSAREARRRVDFARQRIPQPAHLIGLYRADRHTSQQYLQVRYPSRFRLLTALILVASIAWISNYLGVVLPTIEDHPTTPCKYNDNELTYNAKMLFVYFVWFATARMFLFVPCIASRVAFVQARTHGFCRTYCVHLMIRDGPLYIFVVGSVLFWFHLMQSPSCEEGSPMLYHTLQQYAAYSCMISVMCLMFAYWHNRLLVEATSDFHLESQQDRGAPPGTLEKLESRRYDSSIFGDEENRLYPGECPICLTSWEPEDVIKVTECHHAFHEECIGHWLRNARTCALCRQDLVIPMRPVQSMHGGLV